MGFLYVLLVALVSSVVIGLVSYLIYIRLYETALYQNNVYALGFNLMTIGALVAVVGMLRRRVRPQEFLAGGMLWWVLVMCGLQIWAPGGAHLAMFPLLLCIACLAVMLAFAKDRQPPDNVIAWSVLLVVPALMLIAPLLLMCAYTLTVLATFMLAPITLMLCALIAPQISLISRDGLFRIAGALAIASVVLIIVGYIRTQPSPATPRIHCLAYGVDFDKGEAYWLSSDRNLDEWTSLYISEETARQPLPEFVGQDRHEYFLAPAPMPPFSKPILEVREDRVENGRRILDCRLNSPRDAQRLWLRVTSDITVHRAEILGHELRGSDRQWEASFEILPREGADLRLEVSPGAPLVFAVREMSYGLPDLPDLRPRPAHMIPEPNRRLDRSRILHSDFTYSIATIDLGNGAQGESST